MKSLLGDLYSDHDQRLVRCSLGLLGGGRAVRQHITSSGNRQRGVLEVTAPPAPSREISGGFGLEDLRLDRFGVWRGAEANAITPGASP